MLRLVAVALIILAWSGLAFCGEIHDAIQSGSLEKVKALLEANPDLVNDRSYTDGMTPLYLAARNGNINITELLLANKADVNATNKYGWTPLQGAAQGAHKDVVELLLARGANVDAKDMSGKTPLSGAAENGQNEVVKLLLASNADVNATDVYGWTPLSYAALNEKKETVKLLLAHGAICNNLFAAAISGDAEKARALNMTWSPNKWSKLELILKLSLIRH